MPVGPTWGPGGDAVISDCCCPVGQPGAHLDSERTTGPGTAGESPALARLSCPAAPTQITEMNLALEGIGLTDKLIPFFLRLLIDVDFSPGGCKA